MTAADHACEVKRKNAVWSPDGVYQVICPTCGKVGEPQEWPGDAQAIADRHSEVGGFERPKS
jgi:hypothetical protein